MTRHSMILAALLLALAAPAAGQSLPGHYYRLMEAGSDKIAARLDADPDAGLKALESPGGSHHTPYAILPPAVLYAKQHPENKRFHDPKMLALALRIGDLLADEDEQDLFTPRFDSDWDTTLWLEAYRLLEDDLGSARKQRWRRAIEHNVALVYPDALERVDFPWYNTPYIGTSPNHYSIYAANLLLAGQAFGNEVWESLGAKILKRFAAVEQTSDGYWGEHSRNGPTIGYNHLTLTSVALYWELTRDPAALEALLRSTEFHRHFTYPDGAPADIVNDRNRRWSVSAWGQFAFSHSPEGRGYAEFLAGFFDADRTSISNLGRLAQDALYYHDGPVQLAPMRTERFSYQMAIPAGIRKSGPWVVGLSAIVDTTAPDNRFYLDRQGHVTVFHEKLGMIITGANSKRQPELATFSEKILDQVYTVPMSGRLQMSDERDRVSLGFQKFWADLLVHPVDEKRLELDVEINGRGQPADELLLNLQLVLHPGEPLTTGAGETMTLGEKPVALDAAALGGEIRHHGWSLTVDEPEARLEWPVYPYNPYGDEAETNLNYAVGRFSIPIRLKSQKGHYVRPKERTIRFSIAARE